MENEGYAQNCMCGFYYSEPYHWRCSFVIFQSMMLCVIVPLFHKTIVSIVVISVVFNIRNVVVI